MIDLKQDGEALIELLKPYTPDGLLAGELRQYTGAYRSQSFIVHEFHVDENRVGDKILQARAKQPFAELYRLDDMRPILTLHADILNRNRHQIASLFKAKTGLEFTTSYEIETASLLYMLAMNVPRRLLN